MSTYEGEHTIFGLLGQANLAQNDVLHFLEIPGVAKLTRQKVEWRLSGKRGGSV
jgi:hypothetical protein